MSRRLHRTFPLRCLALVAVIGCGSSNDGPPPVFSDVRTETASLATATGAIELTIARIPAETLADANVPMVLGRFLVEPDYGDGRPVFVVSYEVWEELGAQPAVIGTEHEIDGVTHVLVGIAPRGWADPPGANAWMPGH